MLFRELLSSCSDLAWRQPSCLQWHVKLSTLALYVARRQPAWYRSSYLTLRGKMNNCFPKSVKLFLSIHKPASCLSMSIYDAFRLASRCLHKSGRAGMEADSSEGWENQSGRHLMKQWPSGHRCRFCQRFIIGLWHHLTLHDYKAKQPQRNRCVMNPRTNARAHTLLIKNILNMATKVPLRLLCL